MYKHNKLLKLVKRSAPGRKKSVVGSLFEPVPTDATFKTARVLQSVLHSEYSLCGKSTRSKLYRNAPH